MSNKDKDIKDLINHLKTFGFVFQSSEIYGGLANTWDYGPLGVLLLKNIKDYWWNYFVTSSENCYGIDSKILLNPKVWEASGHVASFSDPLIENKINHKRYRADHIYEKFTNKLAGALSNEELEEFLNKNIKEYDGTKTDWSKIQNFNLLFETGQGIVEEKKSKIYLRPETAQGIFINFANVQRSTRSKLPFGIAQIGKSFRNEVTPGNFIFRTREFEQMEIEFFTNKEDANQDYIEFIKKSKAFLLSCGLKNESLRIRAHEKDELSHYSKATSDVEFLFPFGWSELMGIANRGDYDLRAHNLVAQQQQFYFDQDSGQKIIPYVIEPSIGVDRLLLALVCDSYQKEELENNDSRIVLKLNKYLAPYRVAILPLVKKLSEQAKKIWKDLLSKNISSTFDETGSIGKRYRRNDAIGTYYCITFDYDSLEDNCVTIRTRDDMSQKRILIEKIIEYII